MPAANYLALESALIDRLRQQVPTLSLVAGAANMPALSDRASPSPACYVLYDGDRVVSTAHDGRREIVEQRWLVVLCVRHAGQDGGAALRAAAGELLADILAALSGYAPPPCTQAIERTSAPRPAYPPGAGWYPLAYLARFVSPSPLTP